MDSRLLPFFLLGLVIASIPGCGGKDIPAKSELTDQDKKQIEELNQQRVDEWGKKIK